MEENIKIDYLNINKIKPYKRNAKKHPQEQIEQIINSIKAFGMNDPIGVWGEDNVIVEGHGRYLALREMGESGEVPVIHLDNLTDEQRKAYALAHNQLTMNTGFDDDILSLEMDDLSDFFDMSDFGFDFGEEQEMASEAQEVEEDDFDPDAEAEARCKRGQVWQLGNNRLMCGDSTNKTEINKLMNGVKAKLLLTDPPYGIKADKGFSGAGGFDGKGKPIERRHYNDEWDSESPKKEVFDNICLMAENAIIFGGNFFTDKLPVGNHWLVWNKHNTMPTFSDAELAWSNIKRNSVKVYDVEWNGLIGKEKERFHPTQKPVKLFANIINDYTNSNDIVCDFFGGSGSTLIACEQLNRRCFMMELDPHYCNVILKRYEDFTGREAVLIEE